MIAWHVCDCVCIDVNLIVCASGSVLMSCTGRRTVTEELRARPEELKGTGRAWLMLRLNVVHVTVQRLPFGLQHVVLCLVTPDVEMS